MMSRLITVPAPGVAVPCADGLDTYATVPVSLRVAQRADGTAAVAMSIGAVNSVLELDDAGRRHLAELLSRTAAAG